LSDNISAPNSWNDITVRYATHIIEDLHRDALSGCENPPSQQDRASAAEILVPLWPSVIGLMENNCLPGNELHPAVRQLYARFLALIADRTLAECSGYAEYAAWLAGDIAVTEPIRQQHMARWKKARCQ